jgi:SAM-dependent methyltransferase
VTDGDPAQFYTGLVAEAYAALRGAVAPVSPYLRFMQRFGEPALEIGCGHGEPLLDLVAEGFDVTGLDSSADMLAKCRAEADRRGLDVSLACQSMETMQLHRKFAAIYFAGPTFQLVIDLGAADETLRRIAAHLTPDGRALVPLFVPQEPADPLPANWRDHTTNAGEILAVRTVSVDYRAAEHRIDTVLEYRRGPQNAPDEVLTRVWSLRWYAHGEFEPMADSAGLAVESARDHGLLGRSLILKLKDDSG